jgi:hypothetical protein
VVLEVLAADEPAVRGAGRVGVDPAVHPLYTRYMPITPLV